MRGMGTPVPLRNPLPTLLGIAPESGPRPIPESRKRLSTMPGGFSANAVENAIEIDVDFDLEPEPANDVVLSRSAHPPPPPSSIPAPPVSNYALPSAEEIRHVQLDARRERIRGIALMFVTAAVVLLVLELLILAFV